MLASIGKVLDGGCGEEDKEVDVPMLRTKRGNKWNNSNGVAERRNRQTRAAAE